MDNIKQKLIYNIHDIKTLFDYNNINDQYIILNSEYFLNDDIHELSVELKALVTSEWQDGDYHSEIGMTIGGGYVAKITDIEILNVYVFKNNSDSDISFSKEELLEHIKY